MKNGLPGRYLAYMAGRSTPFFLRLIQEFIAQVNPSVAVFYFVIGDLYHFRWAQRQQLDPRIRLIYQHDHFDPFSRSRSPNIERLAQLEERYGAPNLWRYIQTQRIIRHLNHDRKVSYTAAYLEYYEELYKRLQPEVYIGGAPDSLPFLGALQVFKQNGCISMVVTPSWIPDWIFIVDNEFVQVPGLGEVYQSLKKRELSPDEQALADQIRDNYLVRRLRTAAFTTGHSMPLAPSPIRLAQIIWHRYWYQDHYFDATLSDNVKHSIAVRVRYPLQRMSLWRYRKRLHPTENAFYYPLQYEPEASIEMLGTVHRDQAVVVEQISAALPAGYILYVKEHPNMFWGRRPLGFYHRISRLGNVRFLDSRIDGHDVISRCKGVITISGSSGFEALYYGKPVLLLGRTFYESFREGVFRPQGLEDMAVRLQAMAAFSGFDPGLLDRFIVAVLKRSYRALGELMAPGVNEDSNYQRLAGAFVSELSYRLDASAQA